MTAQLPGNVVATVASRWTFRPAMTSAAGHVVTPTSSHGAGSCVTSANSAVASAAWRTSRPRNARRDALAPRAPLATIANALRPIHAVLTPATTAPATHASAARGPEAANAIAAMAGRPTR